LNKEDKQKVAIVHYWLDDYRGGEKVVEAFCEMFPHADIYTHIYKPEKLPKAITSHKVYTTFISRLPFAKKYYRYYLILMPLALYMLNLKKYDLIISSESGPAKGVRKGKCAKHICYCHSPMRYIWDMRKDYVQNKNIIFKILWFVVSCYLRHWDRKSAEGVDIFIANSKFVSARIRKFYNRKSVVVNPPVEINKFTGRKCKKDFYLFASQLVPYKKAKMVVEAFNILDLPLCIIGDGSDMDNVKKAAGSNIQILGKVSDQLLKEKMETCRAFIFAGKEDFGIVFVEALSAGAPVIAYGKGGSREIIENNKTGILFNKQSVDAIVNAVKLFNDCNIKLLSSMEIAVRTKRYSKKNLKKNITDFLNKEVI
jgi:glycosyltransferase involved in cell wall biosynthesis